MKIYKVNKKGYINYLILVFALLPLLPFFIEHKSNLEESIILLPLLLLPLCLILWIYFDTYYSINNNELIYHSAFLKGNVDIYKIKEIIKGKTMWAGTKPALATKGLIIKFNKYDEIYIAPEDSDIMINAFLKINPEIIIS